MSTLAEFFNNYGVFIIGSINILVFLIIALGWLFDLRHKQKDLEPVRKSAEQIAKIPDDIKEINSRLAKSEKNAEQNAEQIAKMSDDIKEINNRLAKNNNRLTKVETNVEMLIKMISPSVTTGQSPLGLNDYGKGLVGKMEAHTIAKKYRERLTVRVKAQDLNAYKIQKLCFDFADNEIPKDLEENDKELYEKLAALAFQEGKDIEEIIRVVGVLLRDYVLQDVGLYDKVIKGAGKGADDKNDPTKPDIPPPVISKSP